MVIDSHCHLDDDRFDIDREQVLARARQQNIQQFIIPATTAARWPKVKIIVDENEGVYASYGLHPMFMGEHQEGHLTQLDKWLHIQKPVAVGECGLDFFQSRQDEKQQLQLFTGQLDLAKNHQLPVIVHVRKALDQVISLLRKKPGLRGVIHSFSGSLQQAQQLEQLGFKLGIAATVSFERAKKLRGVVAQISEQMLLIESDAPDQPGQSHTGDRNEPAFIIDHLQTMCELRNVSREHLSQVTQQNCQQLFNLLN